MSTTTAVKCRAKTPETCRFHGTSTTYTIQDLHRQAAEAAKNRDNQKYWQIKEDIRAREQEEYEMRKASWTESDRKEAADAFLTYATTTPSPVKKISETEYELEDSESIKTVLDKLEDAGAEVEIKYVTSGYDIIDEAYVPILDMTLTNSTRDEEIREYIPASDLPDDYWYEG